MARTPKKSGIVYVAAHCYNATCFKRQEDAEAAAVLRSKKVGYGHEAFFCEKEDVKRNGGSCHACWHVRGRMRPVPKGFEGVRLT